MINILTVHWKSDQWIDVQLQYLNMYVDKQFRVYAYLNYLPEDHSKKFYYSSSEPIKSHPKKLNILSEKVCSLPDIKDEDILIFLDGDAFPVKELMPFIHEKLSQFPLIAVQRRENNGDIQPHPLFCATTVKFWQKIQGNWNSGYKWKNSNGELVSDVGGNLLKILQDNQVNWHPLLRSNVKNYHPVFFGIYDNIIYHHGAGFREKRTRLDDSLYKINTKFNLYFSNLINKFPKNKFTFFFIYHLDPIRKIKRKIEQKNSVKSQKIYEEIINDPLFFEKLIKV